MTHIHEGRGALARLLAVLRLRCPRCFRGRLFGGLLQMNDPCPVCGQLIQREEGYFLGAMYVSYALGAFLVSIGYFTAAALWPDTPGHVLCLGLLAVYVPLMPWVFRYSRSIWIHLDYLVSAGESAATSYEKMRRQEISTRDATSPGNPDARTPPG